MLVLSVIVLLVCVFGMVYVSSVVVSVDSVVVVCLLVWCEIC